MAETLDAEHLISRGKTTWDRLLPTPLNLIPIYSLTESLF
jgi:hypothetical protein